MRKEKVLISLLDDIVRLVADEADRNPQFSAKLDTLLSEVRNREQSKRSRSRPPKREELPDVHAEFTARGQAEFGSWLRDLPVPTLRAVIRVHDLDAARRASKWKDAEKLSVFIAEQIAARASRGSGFLSAKDE
ncbi:MAG TPA: hypothetical protein VIY49_19555 [Bryobacteraceae bacterium]